VYSGTWDDPVDMTNKCDVRVHDLETDAGEWVFHSPWDQIGPTASGSVLSYFDTEELGHNWFDDQTSNVELFDLETGISRKLTTMAFPYSAMARHDKYLAYKTGDYLILCDLVEGGFMDTDGHLCPEGGCADAGADGGE